MGKRKTMMLRHAQPWKHTHTHTHRTTLKGSFKDIIFKKKKKKSIRLCKRCKLSSFAFPLLLVNMLRQRNLVKLVQRLYIFLFTVFVFVSFQSCSYQRVLTRASAGIQNTQTWQTDLWWILFSAHYFLIRGSLVTGGSTDTTCFAPPLFDFFH